MCSPGSYHGANMNDAKSRRDGLSDALSSGDMEGLRTLVSAILDAGDISDVDGAILHAEENLARDSADLLATEVESAAQSILRGTRTDRLFCIPFMVDFSVSVDLPMAPLLAAVRAMAAPGERVSVASGWVHIRDLMALDAVGFRKLTRILSACRAGGEASACLPPELFPRFPASSADLVGGAEMFGFGEDGEIRAARIHARFLLGLVSSPIRASATSSGSLADVAEGRMSDAAREALRSCLKASIPGFLDMLDPGQPMGAAVDAAAGIDTMVLEARLDAAAALIGRKPIVHYCLDGETLHVVMTKDGSDVVDAMELCAIGLCYDIVGSLLEEGSRGFVQHAETDDLPKAASSSVH